MHHKAYEKQHQKDEEEDLSNTGERNGDSAEP
jgi:hypothetical protein